MRETTPVKEVCNIAPSSLMTPRDTAVYIGVKINKNTLTDRAE